MGEQTEIPFYVSDTSAAPELVTLALEKPAPVEPELPSRRTRRVLKLRTLSVNEATTYRTCPRLYEYQYVADGCGYEVVGTSFALTFGSWWHVGQEAWWKARRERPDDPDAWIRAAFAAFRDPPLDAHGRKPAPLDLYDMARVRALMALYHFAYARDGLTPIEVEHPFVAPMISPRGGLSVNWDGLDGRMDLVAHDRRGTKLVVEHKTTGLTIDDESDYWDRVKFDMQISQYIEGARAVGFDVQGVVYDVVRRPHAMLKANKPASGETPGDFEKRLLTALAEEPQKYLRRRVVVRTEHEMREARIDTWATARQIANSHRDRLWPRHATSCSRYGHRCEFFDVCAGEEDLRNEKKFRPKKKSTNEKKETITV